MSTMYYTTGSTKVEIGQTSSLGKDRGYMFTWCMFPSTYARYARMAVLIEDENKRLITIEKFERMVDEARLQTFKEGIV